MLFRLAADFTLVFHMAFIVFGLLGGILTLWRRWIPYIHLPTAAWGVFIEVVDGVCPLTNLENYFRIKAGQSGYQEGFIEHYLLSIIYPSGLTQEIQFALAGIVIVLNVIIYAWLYNRSHGKQKN
jgi:cytochrome c biogenesis protein CcdA